MVAPAARVAFIRALGSTSSLHCCRHSGAHLWGEASSQPPYLHPEFAFNQRNTTKLHCRKCRGNKMSQCEQYKRGRGGTQREGGHRHALMDRQQAYKQAGRQAGRPTGPTSCCCCCCCQCRAASSGSDRAQPQAHQWLSASVRAGSQGSTPRPAVQLRYARSTHLAAGCENLRASSTQRWSSAAPAG